MDLNPFDPQNRIFSDAWHRVSSVKAALRNSVQAQRQVFQNQLWIVLSDTLGSDWFRISPDAYKFICRMSMGCTIEQAWQKTIAAEPELALTQEEVVQLLGQLNLSNLLQYDRTGTDASIFERYTKRKQQERQSLFMGFLAIRIPLINPDNMLQKILPVIRLAFGWGGITLYLMLLAAGGLSLISRYDTLFNQSAGILAPDNLILLYVGFIIAKLIHEIGHAAVCKYYGGEVHAMGVILLLFTPLPFVDATSAWGFRSRRQRMFVGLAGLFAELAVAAVAALIWVNTAPGAMNALAYNVIFAASISTFIFNINPLIRFDGYYILIDLLEVPNLFQRSREQLRYLGQRFLFQMKHARASACSRREVIILPIYAICSICYWISMMVTIAFFIAGQYLDIGLAFAWILAITTLFFPLIKLFRFVFFSPQLQQERGKALCISFVLVILFVVGIGFIPIPDRVRVSGVLEATQFRSLRSEVAGSVEQILVQPGILVTKGSALIRLENKQLSMELTVLQHQRQQIESRMLLSVSKAVADYSPLLEQRLIIESRIHEINRQLASLVIKAPIEGIWCIDADVAAHGRWVPRGGFMGNIVQPGSWRFIGILPQVGTHLFKDTIRKAEIRLDGEEQVNLVALEINIIPHENGILPSPALGMAGGGDIAVDLSDPGGVTATEPFFRIQAVLPEKENHRALMIHGRLGVMRLTLSATPLFIQWERNIRQFLQRRFRV